LHAAPAVHAVHAPLLQTSLTPHGIPFDASVPVSVQLDVPELHDVVPM
jgi:hypothetical protein